MTQHNSRTDAGASTESEEPQAITPTAERRSAGPRFVPESGTPLTPWTAEDYAPVVTGSGALKLASSAVAPLVAAARGYETLVEDQAKDYLKRTKIGTVQSSKGRHLLSNFREGGDVLTMPWYTALDIPTTTDDLRARGASTVQIRPENPGTDPKTGRTRKYELLIGGGTFIDLHPAITTQWMAGAGRVIIAEGLLKGDSTLTAQLRAHVGDDELGLQFGDQDRAAAMRRLAALLERIPRHERAPIMTVVGVGNYRKHSVWQAYNFEDQDVLIAFDADVATNYQVWRMASDLYTMIEKKKGTPKLVSIGQHPVMPALLATNPSMGLDDFFHEVGNYGDLEEMLVSDLPARPKKDDDDNKVGQWRVSADGTYVEECVSEKNEHGDDMPPVWKIRYELGGRVRHTEVQRPTTDMEMRTGTFGAGLKSDSHEITCVVELSWKDDQDNIRFGEITGPATILMYPPSEWDRKGAKIPRDVLLHPEWPPRKGLEWLKAVKDNERSSVEERTTWSTMGWVPVQGEKEAMAFIAGSDVVADDDDAKDFTQIGVTEQELAGATRFGLIDPASGTDLHDSAVQTELRADIKELFETYLTDGPWKTPQIAASVVAGGLRPAVPLPTATCVYVSGAPGLGKSWTARHMMTFWQNSPGSWWEPNALPGSASDTFASTENAVSKTPIWVVDDWAPSTDKHKAETEEAKVGDLIRSVYNKLGKRRSNYDLSARAVPTPLALLVLTAENQNSVQSIRDRVVSIEMDGLRDDHGQANRAVEMASNKLTASRVAGAVVRMYIARARTEGWLSVTKDLESIRKVATENARDILQENGLEFSSTTRPAEIVADIYLGLHALSDLAALVGLEDLADLVHWEDGGLARAIAEQVSIDNRNKTKRSPGHILLSCLSEMLVAGKAHVINQADTSQPPITDDDDQMRLNTYLGWQADTDGSMRPRGNRIGYYKLIGDEPVIFFMADAFNEAQRFNPKRIPYGQSAHNSWTDVWNTGLVHESYLKKGIPESKTVLFRTGNAGSSIRPRGVPVPVSTLFNSDSAEG